MADPTMPFARYVTFALLGGALLGCIGCLLPWSIVTVSLGQTTIEESTSGLSVGSFLFLPSLVTTVLIAVMGLFRGHDRRRTLIVNAAQGVTLLLLIQAMLAASHTTDVVSYVLTHVDTATGQDATVTHSASAGFYLVSIGSILAILMAPILLVFQGNKRAAPRSKPEGGDLEASG